MDDSIISSDDNITDEDSDSSDSDVEEYVVERIVKHRRIRGITQYLVKWNGYSMDECTWEPEANLTNCEQLLRTYKQTKMTPKPKKRVESDTSDDEEEKAATKAIKRAVKQEPKPTRQERSVRESSTSSDASPPSLQPPSVDAGATADDKDANSDSDVRLPDLISSTTDASSGDEAGNGNGESDDDANASLDSADIALIDPTSGWDRGWVPKKVLGVTRYPDQTLWVLMAWQDHDPELVPNYVANEKSPELMIAYYEKHLQWKTYSGAPDKD